MKCQCCPRSWGLWSCYRISGLALWLLSSSCKGPTVECRECAPHCTWGGEGQPLWWRAEMVSLYVSWYPVFLPGILSCSPFLHAASPPSKPWLEPSFIRAPFVTGVEGIPLWGHAAALLFSSLHIAVDSVGVISAVTYVPFGKSWQCPHERQEPQGPPWGWDLCCGIHPCWIIESFKGNMTNLGKFLVWLGTEHFTVAIEWSWPGDPGSSLTCWCLHSHLYFSRYPLVRMCFYKMYAASIILFYYLIFLICSISLCYLLLLFHL